MIGTTILHRPLGILVPQMFFAHHLALQLLGLGRDASQKRTACHLHHSLLQQTYEQGEGIGLLADASSEATHL